MTGRESLPRFLTKFAIPLSVFAILFSLIIIPVSAQAGFFSDLLKFFLNPGQDADAQESGSLQSVSLPIMGSQKVIPDDSAKQLAHDDAPLPLMATQDSALVAAQNPAGTFVSGGKTDEITVYTVQPGDVPGKIAEKFGVSLNTILWANDIRDAKKIHPGQKLVILPVTGVRYTVARGDTLASIAKKFNGEMTDILDFNNLSVGDPIKPGMTLVIPDGEIKFVQTPRPQTLKKKIITYAPSGMISSESSAEVTITAGYYIRPVKGGIRSQGIHGNNGVDLANSCGLPIYASAAGTVIIAKTAGWNGGYGEYVVISHPNGSQTVYGHMSALSVGLGEDVTQGQIIGAIGETGHATGCHIHFEIRGGIRNPF